MVFISRLKLRNFKSFKAADIQLPKTFICFAGPNGSGKCVVGDTEVYLSDGTVKPIRDLIDEAMAKGDVDMMDDGYIAQFHDSPAVLSLNAKTMKIEKKRIAAFVKRKAPEKLLSVRTRSGRKITATEYHPFFILQGDNIKPIRADQLKRGVRVAIPRRLPSETADPLFLDLLDSIGPEDNIYIPYDEKIAAIIQMKKGQMSWASFERTTGLPQRSLGSFIYGKQSILFSSLVRALRHCGLQDLEIANAIPLAKSDGKEIFRFPWRNSDGFCRFLGYLLAEGSVSRSNNQIRFTNATEEVVADFIALAKGLFGLEPHIHRYKKGTYDVIINSVGLRNVLLRFGMSYGGSGEKSVPEMLFRHSTDENLANLLNGLYSGDGYVSKAGTIELTLKSEGLIKAVERILLRFGIVARTKRCVKRETRTGFRGEYLKTSVNDTESVEAFSKRIGMVHKRRMERLQGAAGKKANPNVDLIEANGLVKKAVAELGVSVKKSKKEFPRLDSYCYNQCLPSRHGIKHLISRALRPVAIQKSIQSGSLAVLETLCESDIFWDEIESIEEIAPREDWVYDLTIAEHHNFIANGIFVHNSNLCDAIRFAMGETSLRSLRAKKVRDLIYAGSKSAEVILHFGSDNGGESYEIKRAIREDGKIRYRLNGKRTTRSTIHETLNRHNLDESGRNTVAQGEVQRIISMNGKERRGIIDSVAGIADFEAKKKEALGELTTVEGRIREARVVLGERKAFLDELGREKEVAIRYLGSKKTLTNAKGTLLKSEIERNEKDLSEAMKGEEKLISARTAKEKDAAQLEGEFAQVDAKRAHASSEIQGRQKTNALIRRLEELKASIGSKRQLVEDREGAIKTLKAEHSALEMESAKEKEIINALEKELLAQKAQHEKAEADLAAAGGPSEDKAVTDIRKALAKEEEALVSAKEKLLLLDSEISAKRQLIEAKMEEGRASCHRASRKRKGKTSAHCARKRPGSQRSWRARFPG
ncbi:MAG: LAGLIDADG family homing endonuclease [Candidatus Micrarchaeota archaeon]